MKEFDSVDRLTRARDFFEEVFLLPVDERSAFLDKACGGDRALHAEVTALLLEYESADSPVDDLVNDMIWPALESLSCDPSRLQDMLDDSPEADPDQVDPLVGKTVSHFEILAPIGRGGMGMVYRARDLTLDRTVALKFLPPSLSSDQQAKDRFIHEAKAASGLDHPNIATVHEIGETGDHQLFIAMGYYPGETLKEKIEKGPIVPEVAIDFAIQLASALDRVHRHGVIHRDIKPGNLMITDEGSVKLLDFGLAKLSYASGFTQVGQMIGTVAYMSPEQARGDEVDHRTDIWSMGVVLYEILTGKRPFDRGDAQSTIHAILEMDPEPPVVPEGEVPEPLKDILGLCLAKDPDHRYQSAEDLLEDLQRADEGLAPKKRGGRATWNRRLRRRRQIVLGASAIVLAVGVFIIQFGLASEQVTFTRITEGVIVEDRGNFADFAWGDYDGDGYLDVVVANAGEGTTNNLYHNGGDGTFSRVTEGVIATDSFAAMKPAWADQDNDGDLDLFLCTDLDSLDVFYRNEGDGIFSRVTEGDWVNTPGSGQSASWGDYDRDGFVDLYVANFGRIEPQTNFLYHNLGDGTMEAVTSEANSIRGPSHGCLWSDYDKDGDVDLFVGGQDKLQFRNDGDGVFTWIPPEKGGIPRSTEDVDVAFESADYDNDGDLDILYTTWKPDPSSLLYRNGRGIFFDDVTHTLPSGGSIRGMGSAWGDYDNDGFQDLFIANRLGKNLLYHNEGSGSFALITEISVVKEGRRSAGCAWVDYDNDGDLDLFVGNGMWFDFEQACELYRNEGGTNSWIVLNLVGTVSNRSAIGAKVWAQTTIDGDDMTQLREVRQNAHQRVHFGLGDATAIDTLTIEWPSGHRQEMRDVQANQILTIEESYMGEQLAVGEVAVIFSFEGYPPLGASPEGIACDHRGNLFVSLRASDGSSYVRNEIVKITPSGESSILANLGPAAPGNSGVLGLTADGRGNVYAAFSSGNQSHGVWKITPDGRSEHLSGSENINAPNSLTFDNRGNLYVTDSYPVVDTDPGLVWRHGKSGVFVVWASSGLLAPDPVIDPFPFPGPGANGIVFASPNHVYVANTEKGLILDIPVLPDGSAGDIALVAGEWPAGGPPNLLVAPDGLAIDVDGNLYSAIPAAGMAPIPLSPVITIDPSTGEVEAIVEPYEGPSPLFDYPTSLVFGILPLNRKGLFVVSPASGVDAEGGSGPAITQVGVDVTTVSGALVNHP